MVRRSPWTGFVTAFLAAVVMMHVISPSLQAQAVNQTLYMPILQASDAGDIGLALSNPTLTDVAVTLTARDYAGASISGNGVTNPATLTLPASGQRALRAVEIFGPGVSGKVGWVELQSSSAAIKGFFLVFDSRISFIDGAGLQTRAASRLIFPKVSGNPASPTTISYVNTGNDTLRFSALTFYDNSGQPIAKTYLTLAPKSGFTGSIIDALPDVSGLEGYAVLETGTPSSASLEVLVGFETYRNNTDVAALNAVADSAASRIGYLPHFASGGGYTTRLALVNFTNESQTLTITADSFEKDGVAQTPSGAAVNRTIPPNGRLEESADSLFGLTGSSLYTGYIKWETHGNTRGVIGYLDYGTTDGVLLAAVSAQSAGYSDIFFSHIAQGLGYYTGIAFLNTNRETSTINMDLLDRDGHKVASTTVNLTAGQRRSRLFTELFPGLETQLGGYVRVSASRPIFALQVFGSNSSLSFLANVSAQGVQLQPQASGRVVTAAAGANVISSDANASIAIPPGALSSDTAISLNSVTMTLPPPSSTQQVVASLDAQPSGTIFKIPVRLTFPLYAQLPPGTQVPVLIYTPEGTYHDSGFIALVDESGRTASAEVTHFTTFAVALNTDQLINVTSISPTSGFVGATVTIGDSGFSTNGPDNIVTFAGPENTSITAAVTAATSTLLTLNVPVGAITGNVIVTVGKKTSTGIKFTVPADRPKPSLNSVSPVGLLAGTTAGEISVIGTSFLNASVVRIDGTPVATTFVDATLLLASISGVQVVPGVHKLTVFTTAETGGTGGGESSPAELTIGLPVPQITSLSPSTAPVASGSVTATIKGTGFTSSSRAAVNGAEGGAAFVDSTTMTIVLNSDRAIALPIVISNPSPAGGSSGTAVFMVSEQPVGALILLSAANPTGAVSTTVSIQVEVRDKNGGTLGNYPVTFQVSAGNGSVTPDTATTDSQGRASAVLTLGATAGANTVKVTSGALNMFFTATGTAGSPAKLGPPAKVGLSAATTSIQAGGVGTTITAQIQDQSGNLVNDAGNAVTFSIIGGSGNFSPFTATTTAGIATTTFTSTVAGPTTVQGSASPLTSGTMNVNVTAAAPASLTATGGTGQNGPAGLRLGVPVTVQIKDSFGNVVPNVTVTFNVVSGGGSVNPASGPTDSNGEVSAVVTAGGALGLQTFRALSTGLASVDFNATITQGRAAKLALSTGGVTTLVAGNPANLTVTIEDTFGNTATGAADTISITSNIAGSPIGAVVGPTNGVATSTFSGQLAGSYIITASSGTLTAATANISVSAGPAVVLGYVSGDGQSGLKNAQLPAALVVKATDVFGNAVSGVIATFASTIGGGSVGTINATSGTNGQASSTATLGSVAGLNNFTATSGSLTGSPITFAATATIAPPAAIVQITTASSPATVATTQTLTVEVRDAGGNVIPGVTVSFAKTVGNGSVSTPSAVTGNDGRASVALTLASIAGLNAFTATVAGLPMSTVNITGSADVVTQLVKISGDSQTGGVGTALANPLIVETRDVYGNVKSGVAVTFVVTGGNGSVAPAGPQTTAGNGRVQVTATLGTAVGTHQFTASATGLTSVLFAETGTLIPSNVTITAGNNQTVAPGISLLTPLTVRVRNGGNIAVPNATVNWAAASGGGSVTAGTSVTDSNGDATMTATVGTSAGSNTFTATVTGVPPATFIATAKALTSSPASVDVQISSGATGVGSFQLLINFDATRVQVNASNVVVGNGAGYLLVAVNTATPGILIINGFSTQAPAGNYTVARVTFTPLRPGSVTLSTAGVIVTDINGRNVSSGFLSLSQTGLTIN